MGEPEELPSGYIDWLCEDESHIYSEPSTALAALCQLRAEVELLRADRDLLVSELSTAERFLGIGLTDMIHGLRHTDWLAVERFLRRREQQLVPDEEGANDG